jgi:hypothetical protein
MTQMIKVVSLSAGQQAPPATGFFQRRPGRDDTLPALAGVLIEIDGETQTLVSTDRRDANGPGHRPLKYNARCSCSAQVHRREALAAAGGYPLTARGQDAHATPDVRRNGHRLNYLPLPPGATR